MTSQSEAPARDRWLVLRGWREVRALTDADAVQRSKEMPCDDELTHHFHLYDQIKDSRCTFCGESIVLTSETIAPPPNPVRFLWLRRWSTIFVALQSLVLAGVLLIVGAPWAIILIVLVIPFSLTYSGYQAGRVDALKHVIQMQQYAQQQQEAAKIDKPKEGVVDSE